VRDARESHHERAGRFTEAAHLAVASFTQREFEPRLVAFVTQAAHLGGRGGTTVDFDALPPIVELVVQDQPLHFGDVHLLGLVARVRERVGEIAVVGAEQRATGVEIQAPHGYDANAYRFEQLRDRGPSLRVAQGTHHTARLVQHDVHERLGHQPLAVDLDLGLSRIDPHAELIDHSTVDLHPTFRDQFLGGTP